MKQKSNNWSEKGSDIGEMKFGH